jgi:hypothetical protein
MTDNIETKTVNVPKFPKQLWDEFRAETIRSGKKITETLIEAIELWLKAKK